MSNGQQRANLLHTGTPTAPKPALPHPAHTDANCLLRHQQLGAQLLPNCPPTHRAAHLQGAPEGVGWGSCCPLPPPHSHTVPDGKQPPQPLYIDVTSIPG